MSRTSQGSPRWLLLLLTLLAAALIVLAVTQLGRATATSRTSREVVTAENGIVQTTVTGTGNVSPATDVDANFSTSGTLSAVYVKQGQRVTEGQLLAEIDPTAAQLSVSQAQESLTAAQLNLTDAEEGKSTSGGGASIAGSGATSSSGGSSTEASFETNRTGSTEFVNYPVRLPSRTTTSTSSGGSPGHSRGGGGASITVTGTLTERSGSGGRAGSGLSSGSSGSSSGSSSVTTRSSTTTTTTPSPAVIASAQAAVYGAESNLQTAEANLAKTRLTAPASGTIASLSSLQPGEAVSAGSGASSSSGSSGSGSSSTGTGSSGTAAGSLGGSSSATSASSSSSSSAFAEIIDADALEMTVAFSESDITKVKVGQSVNVTLDALSGVELSGHISSISPIGTTSSSVVSYDATITLDQTDPRVRAGMSASATVIVSQARGVTLPNQAVTGTGTTGTVQLMKDGKSTTQQVITGLRGTSRTQIVSGVSAGQQVQITVSLPALGSSSSTGTGTGTGATRSGRFGGVGGFGAAAGGFGGAGAGGGLGAARFGGGGGP